VKPRKRSYTDAERATALAALDANGGNVKRTARDTGISPSTLASWRDRQTLEGTDIRAQKQNDLRAQLELVAYELAMAIPGKVDEAQLQQVTTSLAIVIDKLQLLSGQPTEINRHEHNERATPDRAIDAAATALKRSGLVN